jgi:hypothetical protein
VFMISICGPRAIKYVHFRFSGSVDFCSLSEVMKYHPHLYFLCSDDKPCKNHIIAFSGFEGEERARVRFMIEAIGAKCTSYFTKHNHVLVCRR